MGGVTDIPVGGVTDIPVGGVTEAGCYTISILKVRLTLHFLISDSAAEITLSFFASLIDSFPSMKGHIDYSQI